MRFKFLSLFGLVLFLTACESVENNLEREVAKRVAMPAFMVERTIDTSLYDLNAWERMHTRDAPANIYIEGESVYSTTGAGSTDPKLKNPVALTLASRDKAKNVAYLNRPCSNVSQNCSFYVLGKYRFAREVIDSYHQALDNIKGVYDISEFNLIGYSGGANIAAIIAAERDDVASLRTVAGNLNHTLLSDIQGREYLTNSLNAVDYAAKLADMPQHHFIAAGDALIPPALYHSFRHAMGPSQCVHYSIVQDVDHVRGWVNHWPNLLTKSVKCFDVFEEGHQMPRGDIPLVPADSEPVKYSK